MATRQPSGSNGISHKHSANRPREREILLLHAWADLSDGEIAQALSVPVGTVKSGLHRARARLRNRLTRDGQEEEMTLTPHAKEVP